MIYWSLLSYKVLYRVIVLTFTLSAIALHTYEYVYPVAYTNTPYGARVLLIYQDINGGTSLYTWDPKTKVVRKGMPSHYTPTQVTVLPDGSGFSFIDNGVLRIKKFSKRSARTVEMLDPLYDFLSINWIDSHKAYTSAKCRACYEIFEIDCEGTVEPIVSLEGVNCLYPQKVENSLFYIESCAKKPYHSYIVRIDYPSIERISLGFNDNDHFDYRVQRIIQNDFNRNTRSCHANFDSRVLLCDLESMQVIGFTMSSQDAGLLTVMIKQEAAVAHCACFGVSKRGHQYKPDWLFNFTIPLSVSTSKTVYLHESFSVLLPALSKNHERIYFSDTNFNECIALYAYELCSKKITRVSCSNKTESHFFKALSTPDGIWYGGSIVHQKDFDISMPLMWVNEDQVVCLQLPRIESYT